MQPPIALPDFQFNAALFNEQMEMLLSAICECGNTHDIEEVHLLTPEVRREFGHGRIGIAPARSVRIFGRDLTAGTELKRSHHDFRNNLSISECRGTIQLTAGALSGGAIYHMNLIPLQDVASPVQIVELSSEHAQTVADVLQAAQQPVPHNRGVVQPQLHIVPDFTKELSDLLDQIGPTRVDPPAPAGSMRTAHA